MLTRHITLLDANPNLLAKLRAESLSTIEKITWKAAGVRLLSVYRQTIAAYRGLASYADVRPEAIAYN